MQKFVPNTLLHVLLACVYFIPISYFALQAISAPFFPGYDFAIQEASDLGSPQSQRPLVFNLGSIASGGLGLLGAVGLFIALARAGIGPAPEHFVPENAQVQTFSASSKKFGSNFFGFDALVLPLCLAVAAAAASCVWAGVYPLPDAKHGENPFAIGLFVMPAAALLLWGRAGLVIKIYLVLNALAFATFAALVMTQVISASGWNQRVFAAIVFGPIGAAGWVGQRCLKVTRETPITR